MKFNYFFSKPDIYININKVKSSKVILITGLSGSGKSHLTDRLVELWNFDRCSFDNLLENDIMYNPTKFEKKLLKIFIERNPKYKEVKNRRKKVKDFFNDFLDFSLEYLKENNNNITILDCAGFINIDVIKFEKIQHLPIIVKQTSYFKGIIRRLKRTYKYLNKTNTSKLKVIYRFFRECLYLIKRTPIWIRRKKKFLNKLRQCNITKYGRGEIFYVK